MLIKVLLFIFLSTIQFSTYAYELLSCRTTVSPGCEGGVLSHKCTSSFISNIDKLNEPNSFDENLDIPGKEEGNIPDKEEGM